MQNRSYFKIVTPEDNAQNTKDIYSQKKTEDFLKLSRVRGNAQYCYI